MILALLSVTFSSLALRGMDDSIKEHMREVNAFAIAIQGTESGTELGTQIAYQEMLAFERTLPFFLRTPEPSLPLGAPTFGNSLEKDAYRTTLQDYAAGFRNRLDRATKALHTVQFTFQILAFIAILANLYLARTVLRSSDSLLRDISRGVGSLRTLLKDGTLGDEDLAFPEIGELGSFYYDLNQIARMIGFDRTLQEIDIHGNLNLLLAQLHRNIHPFLECDRIALAFITGNGQVTAETAFTTYADIHLYPGFSERLDVTTLAKLTEKQEARIINDLEAYAAGREISESTRLLLAEGVRANIACPLFFKEKCVGFLFVSTREEVTYSRRQADELFRIVNILKHKLYIEFVLQQTIAELANAFVVLMSEKDNETALHIDRMAAYSYLIAKSCAKRNQTIEPRFLREILWFASLHDIGKVGIPDAILLKPGPLDPLETEIMRGHVAIGKRIIGNMDERLQTVLSQSLLGTAVDIIRGHHERFDGTGYPLGLSGTDIPLAGRIVMVADIFDALTSKRPYKPAFTVERSVGIMETEMSNYFDPEVFAAFQDAMPEILKIYDRYREV